MLQNVRKASECPRRTRIKLVLGLSCCGREHNFTCFLKTLTSLYQLSMKSVCGGHTDRSDSGFGVRWESLWVSVPCPFYASRFPRIVMKNFITYIPKVCSTQNWCWNVHTGKFEDTTEQRQNNYHYQNNYNFNFASDSSQSDLRSCSVVLLNTFLGHKVRNFQRATKLLKVPFVMRTTTHST